MSDKTIDLDQHRGMKAQKATELRRLLADVEANERALRLRQDELQAHMVAAPAANWGEAVEKVRYVLGLYTTGLASEDTRGRALVAAVLEDLERLARQLNDDRSSTAPATHGDSMTVAPTAASHPSAVNPDRQDVLKEIGRKWSKFSPQDLADIVTNDQLVGEIVKRYGLKAEAAQREVDILMDGRNLSP
jgi:hypothetical protein